MKLVHFSPSAEPIQFVERPQQAMMYKPRGLWVSDEDDFGWSKWCKNEDFHQENLQFAHPVELVPEHVKLLATREQLLDFTRRYALQDVTNERDPDYPLRNQFLDWDKVAREHGAVVITPYHWDCWMDEDCFWYYGWDCASGIVFQRRAIASIGPAREFRE